MRPARAKPGPGPTRRIPEAIAAHLRPVTRLSPTAWHGRVVLIVDDAPWRRGKRIDEVPAGRPHPECVRLPSDSLQLNVTESSPDQTALDWRVRYRRPAEISA